MSREAATQIKEKPRATHEIPTDLDREAVTCHLATNTMTWRPPV
jgi:hypothetical protein